jgi:hypothetical protein
MTKTNLTVANTILEQLGGRRFIAMTGSWSFTGDTNSLSFRLGKNPKGHRFCKVVLDESDTYTVDFFNIDIRKPVGEMITKLSRVCGVYADGLRQTFEIQTGLLTSL